MRISNIRMEEYVVIAFIVILLVAGWYKNGRGAEGFNIGGDTPGWSAATPVNAGSRSTASYAAGPMGGTIGSYPAIPRCTKCTQTAVAFISGRDQHQELVHVCQGGGCSGAGGACPGAINVAARAAGRVRQCRQIL